MPTYIKGEKVANATSYELHEKVGGSYTKLAENNEINFELSALDLAVGNHTFAVKAKAEGYADSEYSNELVYTVAEPYTDLDISFTDDYFWSTQTEKAVLTALANNYYWASEEIAVSEGEEYAITITVGTSGKTKGIVLTDADYNILYTSTQSGQIETLNETIIVPESATKLLLTAYKSGGGEPEVIVKKKN